MTNKRKFGEVFGAYAYIGFEELCKNDANWKAWGEQEYVAPSITTEDIENGITVFVEGKHDPDTKEDIT